VKTEEKLEIELDEVDGVVVVDSFSERVASDSLVKSCVSLRPHESGNLQLKNKSEQSTYRVVVLVCRGQIDGTDKQRRQQQPTAHFICHLSIYLSSKSRNSCVRRFC
jgi:hypothetical protein